jgi:hypothetical protein
MLVEAFSNGNFNNVKKILNTVDQIDGYYNGLTFMHYFVVYASWYTIDETKDICDIIYKKFGNNIKSFSNLYSYEHGDNWSDRKVCIKQNREGQLVSIYFLDTEYDDSIYYSKTVIKCCKKTPLILCFSLKNKLIHNIEVETKLDIVIDLIKKLKDDNENGNEKKGNPPSYVSSI